MLINHDLPSEGQSQEYEYSSGLFYWWKEFIKCRCGPSLAEHLVIMLCYYVVLGGVGGW